MASPVFHLKLIPTLTLSNPTPSHPIAIFSHGAISTVLGAPPGPTPASRSNSSTKNCWSWALEVQPFPRMEPERRNVSTRTLLHYSARLTNWEHPNRDPNLRPNPAVHVDHPFLIGFSIVNHPLGTPWLWKPGDLAPVTPRLAVVVFQGILQLLPRLVEVAVLGGEASGPCSNHARIYSKYITV